MKNQLYFTYSLFSTTAKPAA